MMKTPTTTYLDDTGKYINWAQMVRVFAPREENAGQRVSDPLVLLGIGGATATVDQWDAIGDAWRSALKTFSLPYFHAADFDARCAPFDRLADDARDALVKRLVASVRGVVKPFGALVRPEWFAYNHDDPAHHGAKEEAREHDPCFWFCLERASEFSAPNQTKIVFARTDKYVGRPVFLHKCFAERHPSGKYMNGDIDTGSIPKKVLPLQVADLIIWAFYRLAAANDPQNPRHRRSGTRPCTYSVIASDNVFDTVKMTARCVPPDAVVDSDLSYVDKLRRTI